MLSYTQTDTHSIIIIILIFFHCLLLFSWTFMNCRSSNAPPCPPGIPPFFLCSPRSFWALLNYHGLPFSCPKPPRIKPRGPSGLQGAPLELCCRAPQATFKRYRRLPSKGALGPPRSSCFPCQEEKEEETEKERDVETKASKKKKRTRNHQEKCTTYEKKRIKT